MNTLRIRTLLILHEGMKLERYKCPAGYWTIGVGRNLEATGISDAEAAFPGIGSKDPQKITVDGAMLLLDNDIARVIYELQKDPIFQRLDEVRQAVLVDMGFNMGVAGLYRFKLMWAALELEDYYEAASQMVNSRWFKQVGRRGRRLATMMYEGEWPDIE